MPHELEEGRLFEGRYRIVEEIGSGGFGRVYLAHQEEMDRRVALKVLRSEWEGDQEQTVKERFLREVRVISKLRHPNTVTIHDFGESNSGILYMVLEYIEGEPLDEILDREGAQPPSRALGITKQVAESLAEAHRHGVVHRDLKPANIMLTNLGTEEDFVKVLDFGVAHVLQSDQPDLTKGGVEEGEMLGTPRYMSPEQVRGHKVDGRADIYCLGLLLYELLVGRPAVTGNTTMALITQQISPEALELEGLQRLPDSVRKVVVRCTDKNVDNRYGTTQELVEDIEESKRIVEQRSSAEMALQDDFAAPDRSELPSDGVVGADDGVPELDQGWQTEEYEEGTPDMAKGAGRDAPRSRSSHGDDSAVAPDAETGPMSGEPASGSHDQVDFDSRTGADESPELAADPSPEVDRSRSGDSSRGHDGPEEDRELPPPPDDSVVEANEDVRPGGGGPDGGPRVAGPEERRTNSRRQQAAPPDFRAADIAKVVVYGLIAVASVYSAFLVLGALLGTFLSGTTRLAGALSLALGIPVLTALGETSERERFRVVRRRVDKIMRACIGTAIFAFGSTVLVAFTMPSTTVTELRLNPNWFFSGSEPRQIRDLNTRFSNSLGDLVATTTGALGLYDSGSAERSSSEDVSSPAPTGDDESSDDSSKEKPRSEKRQQDERDEGSPDEAQREEPASEEKSDESSASAQEGSEDEPADEPQTDRPRSATELLQQQSESGKTQKKDAAETESEESDRTPSGDDSKYREW